MSKVSLVIGASSDIGKAITKALVVKGYKVYGTVNKGSLKDLEYLSELTCINLDLASYENVSDFCERLSSLQLDSIINAAAFSNKRNFLEIDANELRTAVEVNLISIFRIFQTCFLNFEEKGAGKIINIGSIGGQIGGRDQIHYAVTKGAQETLIKSIARLGFEKNVHAFNVSPGAIDTKMLRNLNANLDLLAEQIPAKSIGNAEDLAAVVCELLTHKWSYASGCTFNYNGGMLI